MEEKLATVDPITGNNSWSSKGAAGDALQRVPHDKPFIALWIGENGQMYWSKANTDFASLSQFTFVVQEFASSCVRDVL